MPKRTRPPTIITLPASSPPPLPPTSPTTNTFLAERFGPAAGPRKRWLIYFVTGNPGLVGYYDLFLSHLHFLLTAHPTLAPRHAFDVFARSLSGFEARGAESAGGSVWPANAKDGRARAGSKRGWGRLKRPPFGLREQVDGVEWALWDHVRGMREEGEEEYDDGDGERFGSGSGSSSAVLVNGVGGEEGEGGDDDEAHGKEGEETRVVVIGHSVGAYMALEVVKRWRESLKVKQRRAREKSEKEEAVDGPVTMLDASAYAEDADVEEKEGGRIVGGVCLFPTVTHIAKSSSGMKLTMLLESLPTLPVLASVLAHVLTFFFPTLLLAELLALVLAHPPDAARTTAEFLKSPHGVRQALHLAADELLSITADRWDDEVWGSSSASSSAAAATTGPSPAVGAVPPRTKLFFLFGKDDHWVADETRDELMRERGRTRAQRGEAERWRPVMEVDETGIPHGFCIVAERVARYIEEIVRQETV
ncbi:mfs transporter [Diplodia corticola]|uniref:Mfs transporter n=1 Tax=Diplodia corticola TaxID=236234 RepID=A0A1J9RT03_9PEZI|nr:mfs transporter [Diplodia corticola]OJD31567.1 mfs transporter [Diplodia corticola]